MEPDDQLTESVKLLLLDRLWTNRIVSAIYYLVQQLRRS